MNITNETCQIVSDAKVERARNAWNIAAKGSGNASEWMRAALETVWRDIAFDVFLGGYEAVYDHEIDLVRVRKSFEEWLAR